MRIPQNRSKHDVCSREQAVTLALVGVGRSDAASFKLLGLWLAGLGSSDLGRCVGAFLAAASSASIRRWTAAYIRICRLDFATPSAPA